MPLHRNSKSILASATLFCITSDDIQSVLVLWRAIRQNATFRALILSSCRKIASKTFGAIRLLPPTKTTSMHLWRELMNFPCKIACYSSLIDWWVNAKKANQFNGISLRAMKPCACGHHTRFVTHFACVNWSNVEISIRFVLVKRSMFCACLQHIWMKFTMKTGWAAARTIEMEYIKVASCATYGIHICFDSCVFNWLAYKTIGCVCPMIHLMDPDYYKPIKRILTAWTQMSNQRYLFFWLKTNVFGSKGEVNVRSANKRRVNHETAIWKLTHRQREKDRESVKYQQWNG